MRQLRAVPGSSAGRRIGTGPADFLRGASFLGRERDISAVRELLLRRDVRLLTLVGPPGVGKTSLARVVAGTLVEEFADGLTFVDLSPVRDAGLVSRAVAQTLGLSEGGGRSASETLAEFLRDSDTLLVLDNLEQVVECGPDLAALLSRCTGLKMLTTSREPLHVDVERQYPIRPLSLPDLRMRLRPADLERVPATALFVDRARMVKPDFVLTDTTAHPVAEICVRLDGLPLAIEMAAAQVKFLTPVAMARQLGRSSGSLGSSARNLPDRHRTLRSCIAWSYDLLPPAQQTLLRAVAVFRGGFSPEAAEAVSEDISAPAFRDALIALVDKSLLEMVPQPDGTARLAILESIREFAFEELEAHGEVNDAKRRHARYFLQLAQRVEPLIRGPEQDVWVKRLESEQDNFRAAMQWDIDTGDLDVVADLGWALHWFWYFYGHNREGLEWLARVLSSAGSLSERARARALAAAGVLAWSIGEYGDADRWLVDAVRLLRLTRDAAGLARALHYFGHVLDLVRDERREALAAFEESIATFREVGDEWGAAFSSNCSGLALAGLGEFERAVARMEEGHAGYERVGDRRLLAWGWADLGTVLASKGDLALAARYLHKSVSVLRGTGTSVRLMWGLGELADIAARENDHLRALPLYKEYLILARELRARPELALALGGIGLMAWSMGRPEKAARMLGAAEALHRTIDKRGARGALSAGAPLERRQSLQRTADEIRRALGEAFDAAWREGESAGLEDIVEEALVVEPERYRDAGGRAEQGPLSPREREVATLIAQGLSNREIGKTLLIGHRTVATHVQSILNKLGVDRRSQIAAWAAAHGLHTPAS